jgi:hypothetical protein
LKTAVEIARFSIGTARVNGRRAASRGRKATILQISTSEVVSDVDGPWRGEEEKPQIRWLLYCRVETEGQIMPVMIIAADRCFYENRGAGARNGGEVRRASEIIKNMSLTGS